jgi:cystathionine beta-lyase/cystathionine gamma-synthase
MDFENYIISEHKGNFYYNRFGHYKHLEVCNELRKLYNHDACIFPSGMSAISTAFSILLMMNNWGKTNIIFGDELYCDTPRTIKYLSEYYTNLNQYKINVEDDNNILDIINNKIDKTLPSIMFIESCSNPNGKIFNFDLLKIIKQNVPNIKIIVDNTWITSAIFNPFSFDDVDLVVISMTKYYGAGKSGIMGAVISKTKDLSDKVFNYGKIMGLHVNIPYCNKMVNNIKNLNERIFKSSELTLNIAKYIQNKNFEVNYPLLENNNSYHKAIKYFKNIGPSVLTFNIPLKKKNALEWMRQSTFECSTSFGGNKTKFDQWPIYSNNLTTCRLSIGYEDTYENITKELDRILNLIK